MADGGAASTDPLKGVDRLDAATEFSQTTTADVKRQVEGGGYSGAGITGAAAVSGSILDQQILVVNQKAKLIEITNQYRVFDAEGNQIGSVNQVGQSGVVKAMRLLTNVDQFLTTRLDVVDISGEVLLRLTRPAKVFKSSLVVSNASGTQIGMIKQKNMIGKINFALLDASGSEVGQIKAENWRAWNFRIEDSAGTEVARITKTWEGLAKTLFTTADNYVVQIHQRLSDPLRSLVVASALSVDTALKQDDRGFA